MKTCFNVVTHSGPPSAFLDINLPPSRQRFKRHFLALRHCRGYMLTRMMIRVPSSAYFSLTKEQGWACVLFKRTQRSRVLLHSL